MKPPQPRPGDDEPAPLPHVCVTATTDSAELRSQLAVRDLTAVRAVSVSAEPEAAAALSWTLQQLPRLEQLRLQRAPLPGGLRAFGSGLFQLRVLWLVGCALETLDGVCALPRLQELYVARNRLTDVSICSCLDQLQVPDHDETGRMADVLDVEDNQVSDLTSCMGSSLPSPSPASSPRRQPASPPCPSPRLPAIGGAGARRPAVGRPADTGAAGERLEGRLGEVKINTWMADVGGGKTPPDRQLASECK
ncbi:Leucine-rich repeat-containing protein 56 [Amphibalanus amphitrite]|uniref:Leucine-rich repeat-containing protein 56 n=1 Tax=Amphibalanus amphitrite TaxID=1232801 RepID=A0A6A4VRB3_AMPAM|nr:Leucine-rich repeat-containing protein 56 [Amphibalanus amphitrite]